MSQRIHLATALALLSTLALACAARRYGIVAKRDFIPSDGVMEVSPRRAPALAAINESLTRGALATPSGRRDKAVVRRAMTEWRQAFYPSS